MDESNQSHDPQNEPDAEQKPAEVLEQAVAIEEQSFALRFLLLVGLLIGVLAVLFYFLPGAPTISLSKEALVRSSLPVAPVKDEPEQVRGYFPNVDLVAEAAYVMDLNSGKVLFSKNGNAQLPLASLTKLMTVLVAADMLQDTETVVIDRNALKGEANPGLVPDDSWFPRDLFTFALLQSSNGAARALAGAAAALPQATVLDYEEAEKEFVKLMNRRAEKLQLTQTYFINETGLDVTERTGGGYGSARDVAYLMGEMVKVHPELLEATRHEAVAISTIDNKSHVAINTNRDIGHIPGLIGSKTGLTDLAGGNLTVAFDRGVGRPIIIAVLASSREGRFVDVRNLVDATFAYLESSN